jgi:hypothetical protein
MLDFPCVQTISGNDIRRALKEKLPSFMVPYAVLILPIMPLTPNGKVFRFLM